MSGTPVPSVPVRPPDDETVRRLLTETQVWAVVGLSANPRRPAWTVARFLQQAGKQIVPVHPLANPVHGVTGYPSLDAIPFAIDVVDVFRRPDEAGAYADQAVSIRATAVWFQLGIVDDEAYARATTAGLVMVMDRCPRIEWPRLVGPLPLPD